MNEKTQEDENPDKENTDNSTKKSKSNIVSQENQFPNKSPLNIHEDNELAISKEAEQPSTQFSMEIIQTTSPSDFTPSNVQSHDPKESREKEKYGFCDGCCSSIPIRTVSPKVGPFSSYSVCFFCIFEYIFLHFEIFFNICLRSI